MSRACPWPPSGELSNAVMIGFMVVGLPGRATDASQSRGMATGSRSIDCTSRGAATSEGAVGPGRDLLPGPLGDTGKAEAEESAPSVAGARFGERDIGVGAF